METQRTRIQNFLQSTAMAYAFPIVTYDKTTQVATASDTETQVPSTAKANEIGSSYERDDKQGRRLVRNRNEWRFELWLRFTKEVLLEGFELSLTDPVKRLNPTLTHLGVLLELDTLNVEHPAQHDPKTGTDARLIFIATEMRR